MHAPPPPPPQPAKDSKEQPTFVDLSGEPTTETPERCDSNPGAQGSGRAETHENEIRDADPYSLLLVGE